MKKIFSIFAAILFAGSMYAEDVTDVLTASSFAATSTTYTDFSGVKATSDAVYAGNSAKSSADGIQMRSKNSNSGIVSTESGGKVKSVTITVASGTNTIDVYGSNTAYTAASDLYGNAKGTKIGSLSATGTITFTDEYEFVGIRSNNGAIYLSSVEIVWTTGEVGPVASISAPDMELGTVYISEDNYVLDTVLAVTGANLTEAIVATGSEHVTVSGTLTEEGGELGLHIVAAPGDFSEKITLTSGETSIEVAVEAYVKQRIVFPGDSATMTPGTSAMAVTVNDIKGVKAGTSSAGGSVKVTVPANAIKLHFFAAAWSGEAGDISLSAPDGVLTVSSITVLSDAGISGSGASYTVFMPDADCAFHLDLTGVTEETEITFSRTGGKQRFAVWGATYELAAPVDPTAIENAAVEVKAVKVIENGQMFIIKDGVRYNALGTMVK